MAFHLFAKHSQDTESNQLENHFMNCFILGLSVATLSAIALSSADAAEIPNKTIKLSERLEQERIQDSRIALNDRFRQERDQTLLSLNDRFEQERDHDLLVALSDRFEQERSQTLWDI